MAAVVRSTGQAAQSQRIVSKNSTTAKVQGLASGQLKQPTAKANSSSAAQGRQWSDRKVARAEAFFAMLIIGLVAGAILGAVLGITA